MYKNSDIERSLDELLGVQEGVLARDQALGAGLSRHVIEAHVQAGRWKRLHRGVFVTFSGPIPRAALRWGAVLRAGDGAVLSHHTAAEVWGLIDVASSSIHVSVPRQAGPLVVPGVVLHHSVRLPAARHPMRLPPLTKLEETVLDLADIATSAEDAVAWPIKACQRRLTTPARISGALADRAQARWRADLGDAIAVLAVGVESPLELRYFRDVERRHGLLRGDRQVPVGQRGARQYLDVLYTDYAVIVELDGVLAHSAEIRQRDARRDNANALNGYHTLRYDWRAVAYHPCETAIEVYTMLSRNGYQGMLRPCGKACLARRRRIRPGAAVPPQVPLRPVPGQTADSASPAAPRVLHPTGLDIPARYLDPSALKVRPLSAGQTFSVNASTRITARSAERPPLRRASAQTRQRSDAPALTILS